jgi:hypothetical protein
MVFGYENFIERLIELAGIQEMQGDSEGIYHFPKDTRIYRGKVIVIANRATHYVQANGFSPNFDFINSDPSVPDMAKYRNWAGGSINLSNSGDESPIN